MCWAESNWNQRRCLCCFLERWRETERHVVSGCDSLLVRILFADPLLETWMVRMSKKRSFHSFTQSRWWLFSESLLLVRARKRVLTTYFFYHAVSGQHKRSSVWGTKCLLSMQECPCKHGRAAGGWSWRKESIKAQQLFKSTHSSSYPTDAGAGPLRH